MTEPTELQAADPRAALLLLTQFVHDYLVSLSDRPATQRAVQVQAKACSERIDAALQAGAQAQAQLAAAQPPPPPETSANGPAAG